MLCYSVFRRFSASHLESRKVRFVDQSRNDIPREAYTNPVYIKSRKAILSASFDPQKVDSWRSTLYSRATYISSQSEQEYPLFNFAINSQQGGRKQQVRIKIDSPSLMTMYRAFYDESEDNSWASVAAEYRYKERTSELHEQYRENSDSLHTVSEYHREFDKIRMECDTSVGIEDSVTPVLVYKFSSDNLDDVVSGNDSAGATMLVYYQPHTATDEPVKRPWTIEIQQYKLADIDGATMRMNEVSLNVRLGYEDMYRLFNRLLSDFELWGDDDNTVAYYKADPERYRRFPREGLR